MRARNEREATWWNKATPQERVAYFLGTMRGLGHTFPDTTHLTMIQHKLGMTKNAPTLTRITAPLDRPPFDPTAPCRYPECTNPIGDYQGGRYPNHCTTHRHLNRHYATGMRRTKDQP